MSVYFCSLQMNCPCVYFLWNGCLSSTLLFRAFNEVGSFELKFELTFCEARCSIRGVFIFNYKERPVSTWDFFPHFLMKQEKQHNNGNHQRARKQIEALYKSVSSLHRCDKCTLHLLKDMSERAADRRPE